ncbi:MAG: hypothetical protein P8X74_08475 [Reinekea sp.]|jgi:Tfp pilus assembly protein PilX
MNNSQSDFIRQQGAVMLTTLVLLLIVTVLSINLSNTLTTNKKLVQNEATRALTEQYAQNIATMILGDVNNFLDPTTISVPATYQGFNVSYTDPQCTRSEVVAGYSLSAEIVPETTYWTYSVTVSDAVTGAATTINVGTKFNFTAGNCI